MGRPIRDYPREWLREEFDKIVHDWVSKSENKSKMDKVDIWTVYDLREHGNQYTEIATQLLGKGKNPSYDAEAAKNEKKIRRAYNKASKIIKIIENRSE